MMLLESFAVGSWAEWADFGLVYKVSGEVEEGLCLCLFLKMNE